MIPFYEEGVERYRVVQFRRGFLFPTHLHAEVEIAYCHRGQISMHVDGVKRTLAAGEVAVVFPNMVHSYEPLEDDEAEGAMLIFDAAFVPEQTQVLRGMQPLSPYVSAAQCSEDVGYAVRTLEAEWEGARDEAVCRALLSLMLARLMPKMGLREVDASAPDDLMVRAVQLLAQQYTQQVTLTETARALGVSAYHLSHLFSKRLRTGFCAYVNALRLEQAVTLLKNSRLPITQICYDCGFESQRTFNRVFLGTYGVTPRAFRKGLKAG